MPIASKSIAGAKGEANANATPSAAATSAPNVLDPRIQMGTRRPAPGTACTACPGCGSARNSITPSTRVGTCPPGREKRGGARAPNPGHVVMPGQPEPPIAQLLRVLRQLQRVPEGLRRRAALKDGSESENRQYQPAAPRFGVGFSTSRSAATPG